jgi:hypothetical protein
VQIFLHAAAHIEEKHQVEGHGLMAEISGALRLVLVEQKEIRLLKISNGTPFVQDLRIDGYVGDTGPERGLLRGGRCRHETNPEHGK